MVSQQGRYCLTYGGIVDAATVRKALKAEHLAETWPDQGFRTGVCQNWYLRETLETCTRMVATLPFSILGLRSLARLVPKSASCAAIQN